MFGYDFMIDESYNSWIIEINKSPSMDTNTVIFHIFYLFNLYLFNLYLLNLYLFNLYLFNLYLFNLYLFNLYLVNYKRFSY